MPWSNSEAVIAEIDEVLIGIGRKLGLYIVSIALPSDKDAGVDQRPMVTLGH
jgi:hypothetical protein